MNKFLLLVVLVVGLPGLTACSGPVIRLSAGNQILASNTYEDQAKIAQEALRWERQRTQELQKAYRAQEMRDKIVQVDIPHERCLQALAQCHLMHLPEAQCKQVSDHCAEMIKRK